MSVADKGSTPFTSTMGVRGLDVVGRDKLASKRAFSLKIAKTTNGNNTVSLDFGRKMALVA